MTQKYIPTVIDERIACMEKISKKQMIFISLCLFTVAAALIKLDEILKFAGRLFSLMIPVLSGALTAAVLNSPEAAAEKLIRKMFPHIGKRALRISAVMLVYLAIAGIIAGIISFAVPRLAESVSLFANSFDGYYTDFMRRMERLEKNDRIMRYIGALIDEAVRSAETGLPMIAEKAYSITSSVLLAAADVLITTAVSVYLLLDKEHFILMTGKLLSAFLSEKKMYSYVRFTGIVTGCFSRFICGQLTEAAVLGGLCFIGMVLFGFSYPLLISTIIAVTALIPVVGALIGTIPSALMLFMIKPSQAVWFIVFIIVLQQIENSLIYPKIVGRSVGLPPLIILIAMIIGAGIGGAAGIMAGIPVASVIYIILREKVSREFSADGSSAV